MEFIQVDFPWFITIFLLLLTIITITKLSHKSQPSKPLPPGPPKLPLIGNLHQLASNTTLPHHRLAELARVYGPIMHLQVGEVPTVVVSSADAAKDVMKTHDSACCSRPRLILGKELFYDYSDIVLAPYGEYWRQVRKIATLELFTSKRVESFRPIREEEVAQLVESIGEQAGSVVNLSEKLFGLTFGITSRAAFSKKGKGQKAFQELIAGTSALCSGFSIADIYPSLKLLHSVSGMRRKIKELVRGSNKILDPIIEEHKFKKTQSQEDEDFVDVLLKYHEDNVNDGEFFLTTDNIKAIIWVIFGAGSETSSTVVEWAMSELIKNPRVMKKVQEEVRQSYKTKGVVDETQLEKLIYLKMVIKETLRLHPPAPLLVPRETIERCEIQSFDIPSETRIIINAWAIARDPNYWLDAEKFIPERFESSTIDYKGTNFELIPFGAGRRGCPGMALGIANVELPLAMLLYHFDWKLPNKQVEDLDMDESYGITVRRKNDLFVIPVSYF